MVKKTVRFLVLSILVSPFIFFLNAGFLSDSVWRIFQSISFCLIFGAIFVWPNLRRYTLILSGFFVVMMAVVFVLGQIDWAEIFGSSSFGLLLIILASYLPQFIKKGYVEKL